MPRPNSESNRLMLLKRKVVHNCCTRRTPYMCICSTHITCPLTFAYSSDYTVDPGYVIQKISSNPNVILSSRQSYSYQNVRLSITYTVDITIPQIIVALSPTSSYDDVLYILTIDSNGITLEAYGFFISLIFNADTLFIPYWTQGRVINITLTTLPSIILGNTRINIDIDNGDNIGNIEIPISSLPSSICGLYTIVKFPTINTSLTLKYFGLA